MDKCAKAVLTIMALSLLALPVRAEEKVWYCEMTGLAKTDIEGDGTYNLQKFKMKVSERNVVFGKGGFFNDAIMPITVWINSNLWQATDHDNVASFKDGEFHYAQSAYHLAVAVSARCDNF